MTELFLIDLFKNHSITMGSWKPLIGFFYVTDKKKNLPSEISVKQSDFNTVDAFVVRRMRQSFIPNNLVKEITISNRREKKRKEVRT